MRNAMHMQPDAPSSPAPDAGRVAALRTSFQDGLRRHLAAAAVAPPERLLFARDAVANDRRQLVGLAGAVGTAPAEMRRLLVEAARAHLDTVRCRGTADAPRVPPEQLSTGHSRSTYLAMCMALAGDDAALARDLARFVWDPPGASYAGPGSVLCSPAQQALAEALKHLLPGDAAAAARALGGVTRIDGDGIGELLMLRGLVEGDAQRLLDGLARQLDAHARRVADEGAAAAPEAAVCLAALGLAALAVGRGLVPAARLPLGHACFPRAVIAPSAEGGA